MNYIYGDATQAPFRVDYIALLRASLDFAVEHLLCEQRRHALGTQTLGVRSAADGEIRRLEELGRTVGKALDDALGSEVASLSECAEAIVTASAAQVHASIEKVRAQLATDLAALADQERAERARSLAALAALLASHDLPDTSFSLSLRQQGGTHYAGRVATTSGLGLDAELSLAIPTNASSPFASMVKVERFAPRLELHAPEVGGWFSKSTTMKPQPVDKLYVVELAVGEGGSFKLRAGVQGTGFGWDAVIGADDSVELTYWNERGESLAVDPPDADADKVRALYAQLAAAASEARWSGATLVSASLDGDAFAEHEEPTVLVERLVDEIAPTVQEIARRSKSTDELVIKRITGDSRREEIFVSKADLVSKLATLPANVRELFTPLGLEDGTPSSRPPPQPKNPSRPPPPVPSVEPGKASSASVEASVVSLTASEEAAVEDVDLAPSAPPPRTSGTPPAPPKLSGRPSAASPEIKRGKP